MFAHPAREWIIPPPDGVASRALIDTLGISPLTAAVLVARGAQTFDEAGAALNQEGGTCPDPFLLSGMEHAVDMTATSGETRPNHNPGQFPCQTKPRGCAK